MAIRITNPLKYIDIEKIHPNIDNPRQELGDLTELIDSVKENGVMQNLTVFQKGDKFIILMGHRRYAAAKAAIAAPMTQPNLPRDAPATA